MNANAQSNRPARIPRATYRLQFHSGFTLRDALELIPYLDALGVSHIYASPLTRATPGSTHGYDVCDHNRLNPELGTEADLQGLVDALHKRGMGLVLDIVPNHMGANADNPWWWDVLRHAQASFYANYFDIDWNSSDTRLRGKILLPVLGEEYHSALETGKFDVQLEHGMPIVRYYSHRFPIVLTPGVVQQRTLSEVVTELNASQRALDSVLQHQVYRLVHWHYGDSQVNYRRFFNITGLAGVRVEDPDVFKAVHELVLRWYAEGVVDGLRVDHIDGLRDPSRYLQQLRAAAPDAWLLVEKILGWHEELPEEWPVDGTTGYDFMNRVSGLFIDGLSAESMTEFYAKFTGEPTDCAEVLRESQRLVLRELLSAEVNRLTQLLIKSAAHNWHRETLPHPRLKEALIEVMACFPVYRSYVQPDTGVVHEADEIEITAALDTARQERPDISPALFDFIADVLLLRWNGEIEREVVYRFQQLTGPAMAKGAEDTACYRYNRLIALNTVGGEPEQFGVSRERFHLSCLEAQKRWPNTMLATSTHDTKRGEDVRARICLLSEIPEKWQESVERWFRMNSRYRSGRYPDRNIEYFFYQTLVGAWPLPVDRAWTVMEKVAREAKQHTSWNRHNVEYERVLREFVIRTLGDHMFLSEMARFITPLIEPGYVNSLSQNLLKLTAPGVPDIYQGNELWDWSLVDPDNRRPVDFDLRERFLTALNQIPLEVVWNRRSEGLPKLWMIHKTLQFRKRHPELFNADSAYMPMRVRGSKARHALVFQRGDGAVVVAPRLVLQLGGEWADTEIQLPAGEWQNEFTNETIAGPASARVADLLKRFPVALLSKKEMA